MIFWKYFSFTADIFNLVFSLQSITGWTEYECWDLLRTVEVSPAEIPGRAEKVLVDLLIIAVQGGGFTIRRTGTVTQLLLACCCSAVGELGGVNVKEGVTAQLGQVSVSKAALSLLHRETQGEMFSHSFSRGLGWRRTERCQDTARPGLLRVRNSEESLLSVG